MNYLSSLFIDASDPGLLLQGSHDPWMVVLSLFIAIFASCMALQVAGMARLSSNALYRQIALITGSLALGGGVWAMHFIGMLAFELCARVDYQPGLTLLSLLPSLGASWVALQFLSRRQISWPQLCVAGVLVGAGIGAMHYTGMAAMKMAPLLRYDPWWFALSILVAVVLAILALWVRFGLRHYLSPGRAILASGCVMGLAIAGMHYTGMAAARFIGTPDLATNQGNADSVFIALAVSLITVSLTIFVAGINGLLRYRLLYRQMQNNELRMRAILDTAVDGVVIVDDQGLFEGLNPAAERIYGWSRQELIGRHVNTVIPARFHLGDPDYLPKLMRRGESSIIGGSQEVEVQRKDGSLLPIRLAIGLVDLPGKQLYVGFISDISENKAMENALRDSEQQYRSLIRNIPGVSFRCLLDEDWTMLFISEAVETLTGWEPEAFTERRLAFTRMIHPADRDVVAQQVLDAISAGRNYVVEYRLQRRDGSEIWAWESGGAVTDQFGRTKWIDGVILDVTETKLRNAEFEGTVTAISRALAVIEFDLCGHILTANQNFLDLMGYRLDEIQGQHHRMFCEVDYVASQEYETFWAHLGRGEIDSGEYLRLGKGGKDVWIQASYNPIFNAEGKPFKVVKFATDLSQRREMEEALRAERDRAEQAAAAKTIFLANMSHEIRTPMNAIIGFTDLLMATALDAMQQRHLSTVRHAARSLLGLLNDILDTAKLEKGALELEQVDFSLHELCEQVCASLRLGAQSKGLELSLVYDDNLGQFFKGDPLRIQQVLTNLVGNAVKFTEQGWVRLEVTRRDGQVELAVRDSGIGIAADRLERIFDPFAQADASMSRRFGGTGLGTTIALQLVKLMDGTLQVQSTLGEGSVFTVVLPLHAGEAVASELPGNASGLPALRILAADDVPQNIELLALTLGQFGHEVTVAADGEEAVAAFLKGQFDVVLMDVQMPRVDGLEATRRIRQHELAREVAPTPIIALTASVLDQDRRAARDAGMDGFASKPLEIAKLLAEIARVTGLAPEFVEALQAEAANEVDAVVDWTQGTRLWGDVPTLTLAIRRFLQDNLDAFARVQQLLSNADVPGAVELTHKLRGAAGNLALVQVNRLAGQLEHALKANALDAAAELLPEVLQAVARVHAELPDSAVAQPAAGVQALALNELRPLIERARTALQRGELEEEALHSLTSSLGVHGQALRASALENALNDFDFDHADTLLGELLDWLAKHTGETP